MLAIDSETTGLDFHHGSKPFLITTCNDKGEIAYWEWRVDPETREPKIPAADAKEIRQLILLSGEELVFQNPKFDIKALEVIGILKESDLDKLWSRIYDTLLADHLLRSNSKHDLTSLCKHYLGIDVAGYENHLKDCCNKARNLARKSYKNWMIAAKGLRCMPSAKETVWKADLWLPKEIAIAEGYPKNHEFHNVTKEYANNDSETTLAVFIKQMEEIKRRNLLKIYKQRLKLLPVIYKTEKFGITADKKRYYKLYKDFKLKSEYSGRVCKNIAAKFDYELELPKSANNKSLNEFVFNVLKVPVLKSSKKTGEPSLDKFTIDALEQELPARSKQLCFIRNLKDKRKRDVSLNYLESYKKYWLPLYKNRAGTKRDINSTILYSSLNPTGTNTLRFSSQNPNAQQISKQLGFNLRYIFGPAPDREWWSLDANNIELRLPAYEAGEKEMIALFEEPNKAPFYGSYHLLVFSILYPDLFAKYGADCKKIYASTLYQWVKNGNFAVQYGAVEASGTADKAYHIQGAQKRIADRFSNITKLNKKQIEYANKYGYVETIPDKTVDPDRGYPLNCTLTKWGGVLETVPLNYHIQGSAMWWMMKAMIRCQEYLDKLNSKRSETKKVAIIMQVHDELVFDFPKAETIKTGPDKGLSKNLTEIKKLKSLMEESGKDFGIPTPVGVDFHSDNWSQSISYGK